MVTKDTPRAVSHRVRKFCDAALRFANGESETFDVAGFRHTTIVEALHRLCFDPTLEGLQIAATFDDRTTTPPITIGLFDSTPCERLPSQAHKVALMTGRHPELVYLCHWFIVRNEDLSHMWNSADAEAIAYKRALELLVFDWPDEPTLIQVLHTGFPPMIFGVYRALVDVLRERKEQGKPRSLLVQPMLYHHAPSKPPYSRSSPGADIKNYIPASVWW